MGTKRLVIGSRSSELAMVQARYVRDALKRSHPALDMDIRTIRTKGDKILDVALSKIGDKGLFTKEIEEALLRREIDLAVHSMKDLPTELPKGLRIAAVTEREDPRDVLVSDKAFTIKTLPVGSRVGTSSLRRRVQLLQIRRDLEIADLRGNLGTRIDKLNAGSYDAIILAFAGIKRLGLNIKFSPISVEDILPQACQGALGIEVREEDDDVIGMVMALDSVESHLCAEAERALLSALEGGCQVPIGVYAKIDGDKINVRAGVFSLDGKTAVRDEVTGPKGRSGDLGRELAERILKAPGALQMLQDIRKGAK